MNPKILRAFHAAATCAWALLAVPTVLWWSESILWVALISVYANVAAHFSAWQASRTEVKQDEQEARDEH